MTRPPHGVLPCTGTTWRPIRQELILEATLLVALTLDASFPGSASANGSVALAPFSAVHTGSDEEWSNG